MSSFRRKLMKKIVLKIFSIYPVFHLRFHQLGSLFCIHTATSSTVIGDSAYYVMHRIFTTNTQYSSASFMLQCRERIQPLLQILMPSVDNLAGAYFFGPPVCVLDARYNLPALKCFLLQNSNTQLENETPD